MSEAPESIQLNPLNLNCKEGHNVIETFNHIKYGVEKHFKHLGFNDPRFIGYHFLIKNDEYAEFNVYVSMGMILYYFYLEFPRPHLDINFKPSKIT